MKQSVLQKLKSKFQTSKIPLRNGLSRVVQKDIENPIWLKNELTREEACNYLMTKEIGVFVVRQSETIQDCFVLSVKVAKYINSSEIAHYILLRSKCGGYTIRGFNKQFSDLKSLVTHCSFIRDMIPVLLNLNFYRQEIILNEKKLNDLYYFSSMKSSLSSTNSVGSLSSECSLD